MELFVLYFNGLPVKISDVYLSLKIVFILANSTDPDDKAAFHQSIHCLHNIITNYK